MKFQFNRGENTHMRSKAIWSGTHRWRLFFLPAVAAVFVVMGMGASSASADPVGFEFDEGVINLGGEEGTWANLIDPDLEPPDPPATLITDMDDDGSLEAEAEDFVFVPKQIKDLETGDARLPVVDATVQITAEDDITGQFDTGTGAAELTIPADVLITVYPAGNPTSVARCRIDGFDLELATTGLLSDPGDPEADPPRPAAEYPAAPFATPEGAGEGAMIATWTSLPASTTEGGSLGSLVCPTLDGMLGGPGGTWLSGKAGEDVDPGGLVAPSAPPVLTGGPSGSTASTSASFTFEAGQAETSPVTGFDCQLDGGAVTPCDSGSQTYGNLAPGSHTFTVKSRNSAGTGPAATRTWTVTAGGGGSAELGKLSVKPVSKKVRAGKKVKFKASIGNVGDAAAQGVEICLKAPKKLVSGAKCQTIGTLAAGASATKKFKLKVAKKAKAGKKAKLKFTATGDGLVPQKAKGTIKVK